MEKQLAGFATPEPGPRRLTSALRGALIGAVFLALFITSLFARNAVASSPSQAQSTVPPTGDHTDSTSFALYLPQLGTLDEDAVDDDLIDDDQGNNCPASSDAAFASLPVVGPPVDHPPPINADLNLSVRGYMTGAVPLTLIDINGPTDSDPPQLTNVVAAQDTPNFVNGYQVNEWNWFCEDEQNAPWYGHGCRGSPIANPDVTLLALGTEPGMPVRVPARYGEIHAGGYVALVLYAEETRLTLAYTREDTPARGYVVHLEDFCVDPSLLQFYREQDANGRSWLPAVRSQEQVGVAAAEPLKAAIRDTGSFMDPRSRKDWWKGY